MLLLQNDFIEKLNSLLDETSAEWDLIFIGSGCELRISKDKIEKNKMVYKKEHPATKCTDSYLIKYSAVKKILDTIVPFTLPMDFELNYQLYLNNLNVYWRDPPIVKQGSQTGLYKSAIKRDP